MHPQTRDAVLALVGLAALGTLTALTAGRAVLFDLRAVVVGVVGAITLEVLFLRYPSVLLALWERPGVPVLALVVVLAGAVAAVVVAPWLVGAGLWGLVVYLLLLGCVLAGIGNPVGVLARR